MRPIVGDEARARSAKKALGEGDFSREAERALPLADENVRAPLILCGFD